MRGITYLKAKVQLLEQSIENMRRERNRLKREVDGLNHEIFLAHQAESFSDIEKEPTKN